MITDFRNGDVFTCDDFGGLQSPSIMISIGKNEERLEEWLMLGNNGIFNRWNKTKNTKQHFLDYLNGYKCHFIGNINISPKQLIEKIIPALKIQPPEVDTKAEAFVWGFGKKKA